MPTGLDFEDHVELVFDNPGVEADVTLNGTHLGHLAPADEAARFPILDQLEPANVLRVSLASEPAGARPRLDGPRGDEVPRDYFRAVRLEITDAER